MKYFIVLVIVMISNTFLGVAKPMKNQAEIYFAGGCFWGTEHFLKQIRVGELTGLRWCDVDLENGVIDVNHTLVYYDHRTDGSKKEIGRASCRERV